MNASIIICTYNRADSLQETIRCVLLQEYDRGTLEVLVVDNSSDDHTREVVDSFRDNFRYCVRYIHEPKLGLSYARNCGIAHAQGEVVIFIDDDARPKSQIWAANLVDAYSDSEVCAAGGDILPVWPDNDRPNWLHDFLLPPLGNTTFDFTKITELHYPWYPWGANISFRKDSVVELGGFHARLDRVGDNLLSGGDSELCLRIERAGKKIVYVPNSAVDHIIATNRLSESWFLKRALAQGITDAIIDEIHEHRFRIALTLLRKLGNVVLHSCGVIFFSAFGSPKMRMLCRYNVPFAGGYILRTLRVK